MKGHYMQKLCCSRCGKRLWKKNARLIDGKVLCSACMFAPCDSGSGPSGLRPEGAQGEAPQSGLSDSEGIAQPSQPTDSQPPKDNRK